MTAGSPAPEAEVVIRFVHLLKLAQHDRRMAKRVREGVRDRVRESVKERKKQTRNCIKTSVVKASEATFSPLLFEALFYLQLGLVVLATFRATGHTGPALQLPVVRPHRSA